MTRQLPRWMYEISFPLCCAFIGYLIGFKTGVKANEQWYSHMNDEATALVETLNLNDWR